MKKILAMLLAALMMISLAACGGTSTPSTAPSSSQEASTSSESTNTPAEPAAWTPTKNITVVVPYGAGGTTDLSTRALLDVASKNLPNGVNFVVENVAGSGGMVGCEQVINGAADGYNLIAMSCDLPLNRALGVTDIVAEEALTPLCRTQCEPYAVIVRSDSDINSVEDFIEKAKSGNEALSIGITGIGTGNGLSCLSIQKSFGCTLKMVAFDSAADAVLAVINGQVDATINSAVSAAGQVEAGELKIIGVTANEKSPTMPEVDAIGEVYSEAADMAVYSWITVAAPSGTPDEAVTYLHELLTEACKSDEYAEAVKGFYMTPQPMDSIEETVKFWQDQYDYYVEALDGVEF